MRERHRMGKGAGTDEENARGARCHRDVCSREQGCSGRRQAPLTSLMKHRGEQPDTFHRKIYTTSGDLTLTREPEPTKWPQRKSGTARN